MSTRAVYSFKDQDGTFNVYKHQDGYPTGALESIREAIPHAWALPRFEADEFGAAFVAANKMNGARVAEKYRAHAKSLPANERKYWLDAARRAKRDENETYRGGGVRLMPAGDPHDSLPGDIQYRYEIQAKAGAIEVVVYSVNREGERIEFAGTLADAEAHFAKEKND